MLAAFQAGELDRDVVVVVRFQGPRANGMPELHKLTPVLGVLQDRAIKVALVTDGRMSGASGKVPAAIHCLARGAERRSARPAARWRHRPAVRPRAACSKRSMSTSTAAKPRTPPPPPLGTGRELFAFMRATADNAEHGASAMLHAMEPIL